MADLLLVEDDQRIGQVLRSALAANGHDVAWQRTGASALQAATDRDFDLVLLDLGLPDIDGIDLCRSLKAQQPDGVLVILTARREEMDVVVGLEAGADDYLTKPFGLTELLARVRAHVRRGSARASRVESYECGDLLVEPSARRCRIKGTEVALRAKEFDLLERLAADAGQAVSRETLMADVWDDNWFGSTKTLDVHIAALRRKLTDRANAHDPPARIPRITTLRGHGYRLEADPT
jgi:DNA-binding response OmpR family regulator